MKTKFALLLLALTSLAHAGEAILDVTAGEFKGRANVINKVLENGQKYVRLAMQLKDKDGKTVSVLQESTYDSNGKPIRKIQTTSMGADSSKQSLVITFGKDGAKVKLDQGGKVVEDLVSWPTTRSVAAIPEFWFVRDQPRPGDIKTYWRFDLNTRKWIETKTQYHGRREVEVGGKKVMAHLIEYGDTRAYVDDLGDPLYVKSGTTTMVRVG